MRPRSSFAIVAGAVVFAAGAAGARAQQPSEEPLPPPPPLPPATPYQAPPYGHPPPAGYAPPPATYAPPPGPTVVVVQPPPAARREPEPDDRIDPWDPDVPPPKGYTLDSRFDRTKIASGFALLALTWTTSILGGAIAAAEEKDRGIDGDGVEEGDWTPLYVPVVGPFIAIHTVDSSDEGTVVLAIDGALQTLGFGLVLLGFLDRHHYAVRMQAGGADVEVAPVVSADRSGFALRGAF